LDPEVAPERLGVQTWISRKRIEPVERLFPVAPADLTAFCEAEWPRLVGALSLYTGDAALAEELAQEAIARACSHWRRVRMMDAPGAWLHRVARNLAHSHARRARIGSRAHERARASESTPMEVDDAVALRLVIAGLPERERDAIVLRFYVGHSVRETAAMLGCPEGTVKTLTHRAIGRLRAAGIVDVEVIDA
jgi:RNA polymerase sigma factor (sigma-70 family)